MVGMQRTFAHFCCTAACVRCITEEDFCVVLCVLLINYHCRNYTTRVRSGVLSKELVVVRIACAKSFVSGDT